LFQTADYPLLVTGDLEVGKPDTTRIKSRRIAISSTKWRNIAISNNVGGVKHFLSTLQHALEEERHFALVGGLRFPTWARF
jgi:hypothetical protein